VLIKLEGFWVYICPRRFI